MLKCPKVPGSKPFLVQPGAWLRVGFGPQPASFSPGCFKGTPVGPAFDAAERCLLWRPLLLCTLKSPVPATVVLHGPRRVPALTHLRPDAKGLTATAAHVSLIPCYSTLPVPLASASARQHILLHLPGTQCLPHGFSTGKIMNEQRRASCGNNVESSAIGAACL